jgi:ATP-dependent RNA circularization protein (DNA/RNA ligase family)
VQYPKINSLWKRQGWYFDQEKKKGLGYKESFIIGDYADPEFGNIKKWHVTEKIDGMNIRVHCNDQKVSFSGRTDNAQIPPHLLTFLNDAFNWFTMGLCFDDKASVTLFGEGYGPKIQSAGGNYRREVGFILFDIFLNGWWLKQENVKKIAECLAIEYVPTIGVMTEEEIVEFVKSKPLSRCSVNPQMMEGIVARSEPLMLFRRGNPIMWKLKCKEF